MGKERYLGFDLGATKMLAAAFDGELSCMSTAKVRTPATSGVKELLKTILKTVDEVLLDLGLRRSDLNGAGFAIPAPLDRRRGVVLSAPNMGLKDYPLRAELAQILGCPVALENDVQAGTLGELELGALKGARTAIGVFIGTGIGGGLVIDGRLFRGSSGSAGEVGHMTLLDGGPLCGCGKHGCFEALGSRTAIAKEAAAAAASGKAPIAFKAAGADIRKFRSSVLFNAVEAGDEVIGAIVDRSAYWAGIGIANLVCVLNPEAVALGGGLIARFGARYLQAARASMEAHLMPALSRTVQLRLSTLGDLAVPTGAAQCARLLARGEEA